MSIGTKNWEVKTYRNKLENSIVSSELISDVLLLVKLTLRQPLLSSRTTDTCWLNPQFFAAQIQILNPNKYLVYGCKGLFFCTNNC